VDFNDYSMENRTYRYFKSDPLYGFGYGLSYTSFFYDQLNLPSVSQAGKKITVSARVTNKGKKDGEEVVQLYISNENRSIKAPLKALKGFKRILLKAGETRVIQFTLTPQDLSVPDENGVPRLLKGKLSISLGGGQPDEKLPTTSNVVKKTVTIN
jgi:beta-glucosidase